MSLDERARVPADIPVSEMERLLSLALSRGGEFADLYFELSRNNTETWRDQRDVLLRTITRTFDAAGQLRTVSDPGYAHDVNRRGPSTEKAKRILGFEATTSLEDMLEEVIPWIQQAVADGRI